MSGAPLLLLLLAMLVRSVVAAGTLVPGRDAAHYLWMAEQVAQGDVGALFQTVFHPFYSVLVAALLVLVPALDGVVAGQIVSCGLGALAVWPLHALTSRWFGPVAANGAGFLYAIGIWFARHPADCLSEGPFYLILAGTVLGLCRGGALAGDERGVGATSSRGGWGLGVLAGLGYWTRPEAASLCLLGVPWLWIRGERKRASLFAVGFVSTAIWMPVGFACLGSGFTLTPKAAFNYGVGIGDASSAGFVHYLDHLVGTFLDLFEAIGYFAVPMIAVGMWLARRSRVRHDGWGSVSALIIGLFSLQLFVVPMLRSNIRFVSAYGMLLLPFAGLTWQVLAPRVRRWPAWAGVGLIMVAVAGDLMRIPQSRRAGRVVLRELGEFLRARSGDGHGSATLGLVTEMPRLEYYVGRMPGPPRPMRRDELLQACRRMEKGFAVFVESRSDVHPKDLTELGFAAVSIPPTLQAMVVARGLLVYRRR